MGSACNVQTSGEEFKRIRRKNFLKKFTPAQIIAIAVIFILLLMVLYPFYVLIVKSFKDRAQDITDPYGLSFPFCFTNYSQAWKLVSPYILNSLFLAVVVSVLVLLICSVTAFTFVAFKFRYKELIFMFILSLMMVPGVISLIPQYTMFVSFNLVGSYFGVIIPAVVGNIAFGVFLLRTFFNGLPKELFEAARIDGAKHFYVYFYIVVPLSVPIFLTLGIQVFLGVWNDYLWTLLILKNSFEKYTITIGLVSISNSPEFRNWINIPLAGYVISSIPLIILFAFTSKQFIKGLTSGALKM